MRALRHENGRILLDPDAPVPHRQGEALIRVTMAGICNTDLEIARGYASFTGTLGHEFVGIVTWSSQPGLLGQRVVGEINAGCGTCDLCTSGDPRHCPSRTVLGIRGRDGAFADYLSLPVQNLSVVPDSVSDREAVFTEPLAAALSVLDQIQPGAEDRVAVIGDGKLGQLISRVLSITECTPLMIGKHPAKMELAAAAGIQTISADAIRDAAIPRFDTVVEASGAEAGLRLALEIVRPCGTIVLKSTFHGPAHIDTSKIVVDEIRVFGSRCGRFGPTLRMLSDRVFDVQPLITAELSLDDGVAAIQRAGSAEALKVLLIP